MSRIEIRKTTGFGVSSQEVGKNYRDSADIEVEIQRMEQHDNYWEVNVNPLREDETGEYHDPTKLVEWLNETDRTQESLLRLSEIASQFHPVFKLLMERGKLRQPPMSWQRWELPRDTRITDCSQDGGKLWQFVAAFNENRHNKLVRIDDAKKLSTGFYVADQGVAYMVRFSNLNPIWRPKTEKEFMLELRQAWTRTAIGEDKNWDDNVMSLYRTTIKHEWGPGWAGQLWHNLPELSTVAGGTQSAMPLPRKRYKICWVELKTLITRKTEYYDASELAKLLQEGRIEQTEGHEITPSRFRGNLEGLGGSVRESEEWARIHPNQKNSSC